MWNILSLLVGVVTVAQELPEPNHRCSEGSCYPPTGDLLIGRADWLIASSTCGLYESQPFCISSSLEDTKCFECYSEEVYDEVLYPNSHTIDNVVTTFTPNRLVTWWQSENGVENVSIQLDLEAEFHFTHLIMTFKTFRPAAMMIERSSDYGQSWQVYRYFAHNCSTTFPHVPQGPLTAVDDVICDSHYSSVEPYTNGEVIFRVLDPAFNIPDPYSRRIQNLLRITNLRVQMLKLHTLNDTLLDDGEEVKHKYYYALYDMVVRGNCFCYGHASECAPVQGSEEGPEGMVHGHCVCNHHTAGLNCEGCEDFYQDIPWRPAEGRDTNACKRCECNQHSTVCHFDMTVYLRSGNVSGGVCDDCQHNTQGQHCEDCRPFYYQHPNHHIRDPHVCQPCNCDARGSLNGGVCDSVTDVRRKLIAGQCRCKPNVEGERCDQCKQGHHGLGHELLGCLPCSCNPLGTRPGGSPCDSESGRCFCKRLVHGANCDQCRPQHWGLSLDRDGCRPCDCDVGGALNNDCSPVTGQCVCRDHMTGQQCDQVKPGYYFSTLDHYTYDAEDATFEASVTVVPRMLPVDRPPTWTGTGFVNVPEGERLQFTISNLPRSMNYTLLIRYEPQLPQVWEEVSVDVVRSETSSSSAHIDQHTVQLEPNQRYKVVHDWLSLEQGQTYTLNLLFSRYSSDFHQDPHILIDSIVLLPKPEELELFSDSAEHEAEWKMFQKYRCLENSQSVQKIPMNEICRKFIFSTSALLHQGAMECACDPRGSLSSVCEGQGGQCQCRPNVKGRNCDVCSPGTYGLSASGCRSCECDALGSEHPFCNPATGECSCLTGVYGHNCAHCLPGHWGFPQCQPCFCNGHGEHCHPHKGHCLECRDHTTGQQCERCERGYHGNALLGSGDRCRPCMCPDGPGSRRQFADTCYQKPNAPQLSCVCNEGYKGSRCDDCAPGYYGNPQVAGGQCLPCQCNGNIHMHDPGSCHAHTGVCLKCLHHTEGHACQHCQPGFYGDARAQRCQKCVCQQLGTSAHSCVGGECVCERVSGQCPCLPDVEGLHCDHCSPNTWNLNSGTGCEPCGCHPTHSTSPSCDQRSGFCTCKPGFGGRTCEECRALYWGDPEVKCYACDCDPQGTASSQCNKLTGACVCVEGVGGERCDSCGRGYTGKFPDCQPCHQCFGEWDVTVSELTNQTQQVVDAVEELKVSGVTAAYQDTITRLEGGAKQLTQILAEDGVYQSLTSNKELLQQARNLSADLGEKVARVNEDVLEVSEEHARMEEKLNTLRQEAERQRSETDATQKHVLHLKHSDPRGAVDSITEYHQQSLEAESRVTKARAEPLQQSQKLRTASASKVSAVQSEFNLKQQLQTERLSTLDHELQQDHLTDLSNQVCGRVQTAGGCGDCGGLGCVDEDGAPHCGGRDCGGLLTQSKLAFNKAQDLDQSIMDSLKQVEKLHRMVAEARGRTDEAKLSAQDVLLKANRSKTRFEQTNQELRELIQELREVLTHEVDLQKIEDLSNEVLQMKMPVATAQLKNVTVEIRQHVRGLTRVEEVLMESAEEAHTAERLLHRAQAVSERSTTLADEAARIAAALNESKRAHMATTDSLSAATDVLNSTRTQGSAVETEVEALGLQLSKSTQRRIDLNNNVRSVEVGTRDTMESTARTRDKAQTVTEDTDKTKRALSVDVQPRFQLVRGLMKHNAEGVADARQRAEQLQQEAKDLVDDAVRKIQRLTELENMFQKNQEVLAGKSGELETLERAAESVLQELSQRVTVYSTCL